MKLKSTFLALMLSFFATNAVAVSDEDAGLRLITTRGKVLCGSDLSSKVYAYKDEESEEWKGIDVDFCKTISNAIFGRSDRFEMVNVQPQEVADAFKNNKIDVMLSGASYTASKDIERQYDMVGVLYFEKQLFLAKSADGAKSLEDYKGKRVCAVKNSEDFDNIQNYSDKYNLDLKPLMFNSPLDAKTAFFLKRCDLLSGNESLLKGIIKHSFVAEDSLFLVPDVIVVRPVHMFVARGNNTLRVILQWILNSLVLAEEKGINSKNAEIFIGQNDVTTKNLLGIDPALWKKFGLEPEWIKTNTKELGSFSEIIDRNFGAESDLKIDVKENTLIEKGGVFRAYPFL